MQNKSYKRTYRPIFHTDGNITYWHQIHGWIHRAHPLRISGETRSHWIDKDIHKRTLALQRLGYVRERGQWILKNRPESATPKTL